MDLNQPSDETLGMPVYQSGGETNTTPPFVILRQFPTIPSSSVMGEFMAQVKVMVAYPGFGDEHYAAFMAACNALCSAYKKKDLIVFGERFTAVIALKKECHHRYK